MIYLKTFLFFVLSLTQIYGSDFSHKDCVLEKRYVQKEYIEEEVKEKFAFTGSKIEKVSQVSKKKDAIFVRSSCDPKILPRTAKTYSQAGNTICYAEDYSGKSLLKCRTLDDLKEKVEHKITGEEPVISKVISFEAGVFTHKSSLNRLMKALNTAKKDLERLDEIANFHLLYGKPISTTKYYNPESKTDEERFHRGPIKKFIVSKTDNQYAYGIPSGKGSALKKRTKRNNPLNAMFSISEWPYQKNGKLYPIYIALDPVKNEYKKKVAKTLKLFIADIRNLIDLKKNAIGISSKDNRKEGLYGQGLLMSKKIDEIFFFSSALCVLLKGEKYPKCIREEDTHFNSFAIPIGLSKLVLTTSGLCGIKTDLSELHSIENFDVIFKRKNLGTHHILNIEKGSENFSDQVKKESYINSDLYCMRSLEKGLKNIGKLSLKVTAPDRLLSNLSFSSPMKNEETVDLVNITPENQDFINSIEDAKAKYKNIRLDLKNIENNLVVGEKGVCFTGVVNSKVFVTVENGEINKELSKSFKRVFFNCAKKVANLSSSNTMIVRDLHNSSIDKKLTVKFKDGKIIPSYEYFKDGARKGLLAPDFNDYIFKQYSVSGFPAKSEYDQYLKMDTFLYKNSPFVRVSVKKFCSAKTGDGCCFGLDEKNCSELDLEQVGGSFMLDPEKNTVSGVNTDDLLAGVANLSEECLRKDYTPKEEVKKLCDEFPGLVALGFHYQVKKGAIQTALMNLGSEFDADTNHMSSDTAFDATGLSFELMGQLYKDLELHSKEIMLSFNNLSDEKKSIFLSIVESSLSSVSEKVASNGSEGGNLDIDGEEGREPSSEGGIDANDPEKNVILQINGTSGSSGGEGTGTSSNNGGDLIGTNDGKITLGENINAAVSGLSGQSGNGISNNEKSRSFFKSEMVFSSESGNLLCLANTLEGRVSLYNVFNKTSPVLISHFSGQAVSNCVISSDDKYLFVSSGWDSKANVYIGSFFIYDISNLSSPSLVKSYANKGIESDFFVARDLSSVFWVSNGSFVISSLSDMRNLSEIQKIDLGGEKVRDFELSSDMSKLYLLTLQANLKLYTKSSGNYVHAETVPDFNHTQIFEVINGDKLIYNKSNRGGSLLSVYDFSKKKMISSAGVVTRMAYSPYRNLIVSVSGALHEFQAITYQGGALMMERSDNVPDRSFYIAISADGKYVFKIMGDCLYVDKCSVGIFDLTDLSKEAPLISSIPFK